MIYISNAFSLNMVTGDAAAITNSTATAMETIAALNSKL